MLKEGEMTFQYGLKAGAIGAAVAVVLTLLGLIPVVGCCTFVMTMVLWVAVAGMILAVLLLLRLMVRLWMLLRVFDMLLWVGVVMLLVLVWFRM